MPARSVVTGNVHVRSQYVRLRYTDSNLSHSVRQAVQLRIALPTRLWTGVRHQAAAFRTLRHPHCPKSKLDARLKY